MGKEKNIGKRKFYERKYLKRLLMFGIVTAAAVTMLMQTDNASAAKKKIKQVNNSASTSLRKGVLTVSGKGKMTKKLIPTQAQKKKIKKIIIKKGITELPEEAFAGCNKAEEITISSSVRKIGMHAFSDTAVKDMVIPKTVKGIGWGICERCKQLESLTVPGNFKVLKPSSDKYYEPFVVGEYALKTVKFSTALEPELVRMVGDCEKFELQDSDPNYKSIDGMIYTKDGKTLVRIPYGRSEADIAEGCETIAVGSYVYKANYFYEPQSYGGCGRLNKITIPKTVKKVTDSVYSENIWYGYMDYRENYDAIEIKIETPELDENSIKTLWKVKSWRKSLAKDLERNKYAEDANGMIILSSGYLCGYVGQKDVKVIIPDSVNVIGENVFEDSSQVYQITIGKNVKIIEKAAFYGHKNLTVYIKGDNIKISNNVFWQCKNYTIKFE